MIKLWTLLLRESVKLCYIYQKCLFPLCLLQFTQRIRRGVRRNPQDNYEESIVGNMQESKPTPPPPEYTPSPDFPAIPTPPVADTPPVVTTTGEPGAVIVSANGDANANSESPQEVKFNANAETAECWSILIFFFFFFFAPIAIIDLPLQFSSIITSYTWSLKLLQFVKMTNFMQIQIQKSNDLF